MTSHTGTVVMQQLQHYNYQPDYIVQMLRNIQLSQHFISKQDIRQLSDALNMPSMKIVALIDFYRFLQDKPTGDYEIYFSNSITDQMLGSLELLELLCNLLDVVPGIVRDDLASIWSHQEFPLPNSFCPFNPNISPCKHLSIFKAPDSFGASPVVVRTGHYFGIDGSWIQWF